MVWYRGDGVYHVDGYADDGANNSANNNESFSGVAILSSFTFAFGVTILA
jgi:hypothetical protein